MHQSELTRAALSALLFASLLTACDDGTYVDDSADASLRDAPLDLDRVEPDTYFCCAEVDSSGYGSGTTCHKVSPDWANLCATVLYCAAGWTKNNGAVHCTKPQAPPAGTFCCTDVGDDGGEDCEPADSETCDRELLECQGAWTHVNGAVSCISGG
jgi:hypothetical protein